jgi:hypothetical protein
MRDPIHVARRVGWTIGAPDCDRASRSVGVGEGRAVQQVSEAACSDVTSGAVDPESQTEENMSAHDHPGDVIAVGSPGARSNAAVPA